MMLLHLDVRFFMLSLWKLLISIHLLDFLFREDNGWINHPDWNPNGSGPSQHNYDYAIIKLSKDATFSSYVKPICLPSCSQFDNVVATATGWGMTDYATGNQPSILQKVNISTTHKKTWGHILGFNCPTKSTLKLVIRRAYETLRQTWVTQTGQKHWFNCNCNFQINF